MKFMLNGALTLGTMDGANVEICECVGRDNIFIFGLDKQGVINKWSDGWYASSVFAQDVRVRRVIDALKTGFSGESFADIANYLVANKVVSDPYMNLADFGDYMRAYGDMDTVYRDAAQWNQKALRNVAAAGRFAGDRAVREYADGIWGLK
jgi:starch phosphorylase